MKYETIDDVDYVILGDRRQEISRLFFNDPSEAAHSVIAMVMNNMVHYEPAFVVIGVGDTKLILVNYIEDEESHGSQLSEVRTDGSGMVFLNPIPRVTGNSALPLIQFVRKDLEVNTLIYSNPVECSFVSQEVIKFMVAALEQQHSQTH